MSSACTSASTDIRREQRRRLCAVDRSDGGGGRGHADREQSDDAHHADRERRGVICRPTLRTLRRVSGDVRCRGDGLVDGCLGIRSRPQARFGVGLRGGLHRRLAREGEQARRELEFVDIGCRRLRLGGRLRLDSASARSRCARRPQRAREARTARPARGRARPGRSAAARRPQRQQRPRREQQRGRSDRSSSGSEPRSGTRGSRRSSGSDDRRGRGPSTTARARHRGGRARATAVTANGSAATSSSPAAGGTGDGRRRERVDGAAAQPAHRPTRSSAEDPVIARCTRASRRLNARRLASPAQARQRFGWFCACAQAQPSGGQRAKRRLSGQSRSVEQRDGQTALITLAVRAAMVTIR